METHNNATLPSFSKNDRADTRPFQIAAIILAAGKSERFGAPKVLQVFKGRPFVTRIISALDKAGVETILLVLGYRAKLYQTKLPPLANSINIITNDNFHKGQFSSVQAGIHSLNRTVCGSLLCLIDQPHLSPQTYQVVVNQVIHYPDKIIIPTFKSKGGHPVYIPKWLFSEILMTPVTNNLRDVFKNHSNEIHRFDVNDPGIIMDIDTKYDLLKMEKL